MASPQAEDGYTKIANELLEAFSRLGASGSAWRVFMVVLRKTYGYHKKEDRISLTQFEKMSGLTRVSVCRGLNELIELRVITAKKDGYINTYQVQKDYSLWGSIKPVTSNKNDTKSSIKPVTKTSNKNDTYKRKKEKKDISEQSSGSLIPLGNEDMTFKNMRKYKGEEGHWEEPSIDADLNEPIEEEEDKLKAEERELNAKIRANLKLVEPVRGIPFGTGKDMNFHVKIYRQLLDNGWSHKGIVASFLEVIETDHWKQKKQQGQYPGMNTVQFHLRNKKPV